MSEQTASSSYVEPFVCEQASYQLPEGGKPNEVDALLLLPLWRPSWATPACFVMNLRLGQRMRCSG